MADFLKRIEGFIIKYKRQCIVGGIAAAIIAVCFIVLALHSLRDKKTADDILATQEAVIGAEADNDPQQEKNGLAAEDGEGRKVEISKLHGSSQAYSNGIDVSRWQGKIDWTSVAASGIDFCMIRVGYRTDDKGTIVEDPYAAYNLWKAQEAGIKIGVYFFSTAVSEEEAIEEALWTTNYIAKYSITYPVVYNCEGYSVPDSRMHGLTNAQRTNNAMAFLGSVSESGYQGMFYASRGELEGNRNWNTDQISSRYAVWLASYSDSVYPDVEKPDYAGTCNMWQYTNKGVVSGISGYVDINVAYFSYDYTAEPKDTSGTIEDADTAELGMTFTDVSDSMTAKEETNLRAEPNTSSEIIATITNGIYVTRTGKSDSGWSRVIYNGQTCYAYTQLLTSETIEKTTVAEVEAGITFLEVNESVTAKEETNLRTAPGFDGDVAASIKNGTIATRTGIGDNGWSRVVYNGNIYYAVTSYLTTDLSVNTTEETTGYNQIVNGQTFAPAGGKVTAKEETNLRTAPTTDGSTVVVT
ncbi:MAG: GH25 family lysozyme, partial [Eubacteriales bacterium]|nr:GH25 family lysozyme [Eubacteriales bacterium]